MENERVLFMVKPDGVKKGLSGECISRLEKAGLKFVYVGNAPGHGNETTICYLCGKTIIERFGYRTEITGLVGSHCRFCGAELNIRTGSRNLNTV